MLASLANRDRDYHLVHVFRDRTPESVDPSPMTGDEFNRATEYRLYSVAGLRSFMAAFARGASDEALFEVERRACAHRLFP